MKTEKVRAVDYDHPQTATSDDIAHLAYLLVKEAGICARCRKAWAKSRHVLCANCIRYWKRNYARSR